MSPYDEITLSGKIVSLINPSEKDIDIIDIAHNLSRQCRYNGAVNRNGIYCVASHSMWVYGKLEKNLENNSFSAYTDYYKNCFLMRALLHDAHEAYTGDIISPVKRLIADKTNVLKNLEDNLDILIRRNAGLGNFVLDYNHSQLIKYWDYMAVIAETNAMIKRSLSAGPSIEFADLCSNDVEKRFLEIYYSLYYKIKSGKPQIPFGQREV